ncbi:tetratricopeptide repeat protein [Microseira sp. BLCC-F43]|jgi:tetratricopeptide (TPR) repeat protein|uniref:tetratricopeptide repeat protein n=1 Tax=Microseira sp. BLCC-F43 TaxID=3153602 RepID=UPI0035BA8084
MAQLLQTDAGQKSAFRLHQLVWFLGIVPKSLVLFIGILLLSESVAGIPTQFSLERGESRIAQQPAATSQEETRASAERAFQEGMQLYRQRTVESLLGVIAKWEEALSLYREVGDKAGEAATLNYIGRVYSDLGEKQKALEFYNQSLPQSRQVGDKAGEAATLNYIGRVYLDLAEKQKALEFYNQSLPLSRAVGNKAGEAANLGNIASVERKRGNLNEALTQIQAAIKIIEELRTKIASQQLCASYFATVQGYYQFYIDLLMQLHKTKPSKGYDALALHISERSKARSLLELLAEANVNIGAGADPRLREQERNLQQQLNAAEQSRIKLLEGSYTEKQLTEIKQRIENLITQLDQVQAQIRVKSPAYAAISQPGAFTLTLPQIQQQVLDDDTLLLTYSLGKERSYLWAVTKTGFTSY